EAKEAVLSHNIHSLSLPPSLSLSLFPPPSLLSFSPSLCSSSSIFSLSHSLSFPFSFLLLSIFPLPFIFSIPPSSPFSVSLVPSPPFLPWAWGAAGRGHSSRSPSPSPPGSPVEEEWLIGQTHKQEEKDLLGNYDSDGDKSDYNLVVDEDPVSEPPILVPTPSPKLLSHPDGPDSPASLSSSQTASTPKGKDPSLKLLSVSKPRSPSSSPDASTPGPSSASSLRHPATKFLSVPESAALRSALTLSGPFAASLGVGAHALLGGDLAMPRPYVSLHLSPQVGGPTTYGHSPMVSDHWVPRWGRGRCSTLSPL
uniref:Uncharacterized protein n=1 Tax=Sarcophilus harrisii TaxID=9305 RepID=A0A7N4NW30_SARHA